MIVDRNRSYLVQYIAVLTLVLDYPGEPPAFNPSRGKMRVTDVSRSLNR